MFRDSEGYLLETLRSLEDMESATEGFSFEYFFYENDSVDNTVDLVNDWIGLKNGRFLSEKLDKPKFSQSTAVQRQIDMTHYRNRMLDNAKPLKSDYTLILDSDVIFPPDLINKYLDRFDEDVAMITPNVLQNIKCQMFDEQKDSYYDSFALVDNYNNQGMTWTSNPFFHKVYPTYHNVFYSKNYFLVLKNLMNFFERNVLYFQLYSCNLYLDINYFFQNFPV